MSIRRSAYVVPLMGQRRSPHTGSDPTLAETTDTTAWSDLQDLEEGRDVLIRNAGAQSTHEYPYARHYAAIMPTETTTGGTHRGDPGVQQAPAPQAPAATV